MKILFNASTLQTGGGLYAGLSILRNWMDREAHVLYALLSPAFQKELGIEAGGLADFEIVEVAPGSSLTAGRAFRQQAVAFEARVNPDAVFTPFGPPRWRPVAPHLCGFANGLYLPAQRAQPYGGKPGAVERTLHLLKRAAVFYSFSRDTDRIWVETAGARAALAALVPRKDIVVVPNEVHSAFRASPPLPANNPNCFELLMPAAPYPHKNFALLTALVKNLPPDNKRRFTVTLPQKDFENYFGALGAHPALRNIGVLTPAALRPYYEAANAIFAPSIAEIFSATWLEAFVMERPLLCADTEAAREVCAEAALYFDGHQVPAALAAIEMLAGNTTLQQQLIAAGVKRDAHFAKKGSRAGVLLELLQETAAKRKAFK